MNEPLDLPLEDSVVDEVVESSYIPSTGRYERTDGGPSVPSSFCWFIDLLPIIVDASGDDDDI